MAKAAQQQPTNPVWKTTFWWMYLAFQAHDASDQDAQKKNRGGLLNNPITASAAAPVYQMIHPLTNKLINGERITADAVKPLDDWLQKNRPTAANQAGSASSVAGSLTNP